MSDKIETNSSIRPKFVGGMVLNSRKIH